MNQLDITLVPEALHVAAWDPIRDCLCSQGQMREFLLVIILHRNMRASHEGMLMELGLKAQVPSVV